MIDRDLAGNGTEGSYIPEQLYAGEADIVTTRANVAAATVLEKYRVVALVGGLLVPWNPAASDGSQKAYGISAQPKAAGAATVSHPVFVGGVFNHAVLVWDAAADTFEERQAAFAGTPVFIDRLVDTARSSL
ncbi:decorator protein D [Burkholderia phage BcepNazgul]|uniref:Decorator protein D n=1 Tax=Burkholderia phage BcepNazgul TaxID=242861 RepID=Q6UYI2_9CAUD|nr:decorator protein D [Burkholderia phage BcepNazgul]AAQ63359.1 decorator protein D [Burkholderia phage BcepNazgul]